MTAPPAPVEVTNPDPIPVSVTHTGDTAAQTDARTLATEGQRAINRLWERTQAIIAVAVVLVVLLVVAALILIPVIRGDKLDETGVTGLVLLSGLATNVVTSYFTRTNHTRVGGVESPTHRGE